jgi:hypothetical protein
MNPLMVDQLAQTHIADRHRAAQSRSRRAGSPSHKYRPFRESLRYRLGSVVLRAAYRILPPAVPGAPSSAVRSHAR